MLLSRFKLFSSKYLNKLLSIYQRTVDLPANDDLEIKTEPPNWTDKHYPVPRRFKTSRRFAVRFSSIPITFIWIAVNFVFLNCIFTTMNHLKTGKNREEVKCEESLIYRVDVLRNSASNVDRLPQIWQIPANYPLWSFIPQNTTDYNFIPKYPFMTSFSALSKLDFFSKMPFPPSSSVFLRGCRHSSTPFWI